MTALTLTAAFSGGAMFGGLWRWIADVVSPHGSSQGREESGPWKEPLRLVKGWERYAGAQPEPGGWPPESVLAVRGLSTQPAEIVKLLLEVSREVGVPVDTLAAVIAHESGWKPEALYFKDKNEDGSPRKVPFVAAGLCQLTVEAHLEGFGDWKRVREVATWPVDRQLREVVKPLWAKYGARVNAATPGHGLMLNFLPDKAGSDESTVLGEKGAKGFPGAVYAMNQGFDTDGDGKITIGDVYASAARVCRGAKGRRMRTDGSIWTPPKPASPPKRTPPSAAVAQLSVSSASSDSTTVTTSTSNTESAASSDRTANTPSSSSASASSSDPANTSVTPTNSAASRTSNPSNSSTVSAVSRTSNPSNSSTVSAVSRTSDSSNTSDAPNSSTVSALSRTSDSSNTSVENTLSTNLSSLFSSLTSNGNTASNNDAAMRVQVVSPAGETPRGKVLRLGDSAGGLLLAAIRAGVEEPPTWVNVLWEGRGKTAGVKLVLRVSAHAVRAPVEIQGRGRALLRLPVSYRDQIDICRLKKWFPLTQTIADTVWAASQKLRPPILGKWDTPEQQKDSSRRMRTLEWVVEFNKQLDAQIPEGSAGKLTAPEGKDWIVHPRVERPDGHGAVNYGLHRLDGTPWQTPGGKHDWSHDDYSQTLRALAWEGTDPDTGKKVPLVEVLRKAGMPAAVLAPFDAMS